MAGLQQLAREIGADERTLRRAVQSGAVRARRPSPRHLEIESGERAYLKEFWSLLVELRRALRTEPNVRLAVLYGSRSRGDATADSDVDLLVVLRHDSHDAHSGLAQRLGDALGAEIDLAFLNDVERRDPIFLSAVLDDGRVLVDRDGAWSELEGRRQLVARRAAAERTRRRSNLDRILAAVRDGQI